MKRKYQEKMRYLEHILFSQSKLRTLIRILYNHSYGGFKLIIITVDGKLNNLIETSASSMLAKKCLVPLSTSFEIEPILSIANVQRLQKQQLTEDERMFVYSAIKLSQLLKCLIKIYNNSYFFIRINIYSYVPETYILTVIFGFGCS